MYFVCSAFFNMGKKRNDIVSFLYKVFPIYFPAGESVLAKKMPGVDKVRERRIKRRNRKENIIAPYLYISLDELNRIVYFCT